MRVLFDIGAFYEVHGGVSRYYYELLRRLPSVGVDVVLPMLSTVNAYLQETPFNVPKQSQLMPRFLRGASFRGRDFVLGMLSGVASLVRKDPDKVNRDYVREVISRGNFDVLHVTAPHLYGDDWRLVAGKKPIVVTVHDLIPELGFPPFSRRYVERVRRCRREMLAVATRVISVSENTKKDIMRLYGVPEEKIDVIHHGANSTVPKVQSCSVVDESPYLLFVGRKSGYKNFKLLSRVMRSLRNMGIRLLCTDDRMVEYDLAKAYAGAIATVCPSAYEGFGLPLLEAWSQGCPVICSRASCFPEIAADAALYFDLDDIGGLKHAIVELVSNPRLRVQMVAKGYERLRLFDWNLTARRTARAYGDAVKAIAASERDSL